MNSKAPEALLGLQPDHQADQQEASSGYVLSISCAIPELQSASLKYLLVSVPLCMNAAVISIIIYVFILFIDESILFYCSFILVV